MHVAEALESETIRGETASRVVAATKGLIAQTGTDVGPLMQQFSVESQQMIAGWFA
jgi:hypothetical protein